MAALSDFKSSKTTPIQSTATTLLPRQGHALAIDNVTHRFGQCVALKQIDLDIRPGELVALLGPSGCGKTTLLRAIAGFLKPSNGHIRIDGQPIEHIPTRQRGVGVVFQNYALFPHMTVQQNVAYGLRSQGLKGALVKSKVAEMLALVKLSHVRARFPSELSGEQQQMVALARALAVEPKILLLDEPFSALDKNLRLDMQIEVKRLLIQQGITTIFATHAPEEALSMADRIAVMDQGVVQQFAAPTEIYDRPASILVSQLVGTSNLLPVRFKGWESPKRAVMEIEPGSSLLVQPETESAIGESLRLAIHPENFRVYTTPGVHRLAGTIEVVLPLRSSTVYDVKTASGTTFRVTQPRFVGVPLLEPGQQIYLELNSPQACSTFPQPHQRQPIQSKC